MDAVRVLVDVESKNITLPTDKITLKASVNSTSPKQHKTLHNSTFTTYSYQWTLLEHGRGNTSMEKPILSADNKNTLILLQPKVGEYKFKVILSGSDGSKGEGFGTVNVFPGTTSNINTIYFRSLFNVHSIYLFVSQS